MIFPPDFEAVYAADPDPYRVATSFYEARKLAVVTAVIPAAHHAQAWDPACGTGHLAAALATRVDTVVATDLAVGAVDAAAELCREHVNVAVAQHTMPDPLAPEFVGAGFDLIMVSEFLYYLDRPTRDATVAQLNAVASPTCDLVSVHWRHHPHDAYVSGFDVEAELTHHQLDLGWRQTTRVEDDDFVVSVLRRGTEASP